MKEEEEYEYPELSPEEIEEEQQKILRELQTAEWYDVQVQRNDEVPQYEEQYTEQSCEATATCDHETLHGDLDDVRDQLSSISSDELFDNDITILTLQPGVGKSTWCRNFCNDHPEIQGIGVFSPRHNLLDEFKGFNHWKGINRICPRRNHVWFKKLRNLELNASVICSLCGEKSECPYHQQFKNTNRVAAPNTYLNTTKYIDPINLFFIEESIFSNPQTFVFDEDEITEALTVMNINPELLSRIINREYDDEDIEYIAKQRIQVLRSAVTYDDHETVKKVNKLSHEVLRYCKNSDEYHLPRIFKVFDIAQTTPVVILHAGFSEDVFKKLLERYKREYGGKDLKIKIYTSEIRNKNTKLYQITQSDYGKKTIKERKDQINYITGKITDIFGRDQIFVLTHKEDLHFDANTKQHTFNGLNAKSFGNTSGLNEFKDYKVAIIIGSLRIPPENFVDLNNSLFDENIEHEYIVKYAESRSSKKQKLRYTGTPLETLELIEMMSHYDSIHRNRGLLYDRIIFVLGPVPKRCKDEFNCKIVEKSKIESFFEELKDTEYLSKSSGLNSMLVEVLDLHKEGLTPTEIAKELDFRIPRTTKYHTKEIKKVVNAYDELAKKYDQIFKRKKRYQ